MVGSPSCGSGTQTVAPSYLPSEIQDKSMRRCAAWSVRKSITTTILRGLLCITPVSFRVTKALLCCSIAPSARRTIPFTLHFGGGPIRHSVTCGWLHEQNMVLKGRNMYVVDKEARINVISIILGIFVSKAADIKS